MSLRLRGTPLRRRRLRAPGGERKILRERLQAEIEAKTNDAIKQVVPAITKGFEQVMGNASRQGGFSSAVTKAVGGAIKEGFKALDGLDFAKIAKQFGLG